MEKESDYRYLGDWSPTAALRGTLVVKMINILFYSSTQRLLAEEDHVIDTLTFDGRYKTFSITVLLRAAYPSLDDFNF
ncbi:hypothetical protein QEH59_16935 [Coraliomargarita sp. SDUM461004]|uniref:Uncharacterized protein n=1 Tax=Thalassobacterium sedimentorum TaxID=3041258 RepID=A0ABU1AMU6_9BACT|nr:hypothetical protein [Coraliomargarita sp. SDUM461004]MDQ8196123.1 hypothetical protein [Coraliomargarita sp. SDUM461004]